MHSPVADTCDDDTCRGICESVPEQLDVLSLCENWKIVENSLLTAVRYPHLRTLTLILPNVNPGNFPWRDIETLQLTEFNVMFEVHAIAAPAFPAFLRALGHLGSLKTLRFACNFREDRIREQDPSCICSSDFTNPNLSNLTELYLRLPSSALFHALRHIKFPTSAKVRLACDPVLERALLKSSFFPFLSAFFEQNPCREICLGSCTDADRPPWQLRATRSVGAALELDLHDEGLLDGLGSLAAYGQDTRSIDICFWPNSSNDRVFRSLFIFRKVSSIRLAPENRILERETGSASHWLAIGMESLLAPSSNEWKSTRLPFPELQILDLHCVEFSATTIKLAPRFYESQPKWLISPLFTSTLARILKTRREAGAPAMIVYLAKRLEETFYCHVEGAAFLRESPEIQFV